MKSMARRALLELATSKKSESAVHQMAHLLTLSMAPKGYLVPKTFVIRDDIDSLYIKNVIN
ncbi:hypothetical protein KM92DES2_10623 [uncultured Desulfovibrio sp.]|uniref:Uncharacterized protein n=1 Tax=uncultured Desulfovibrio sp. TaxID=167968 RepID=A0A212J6T7_9BACT|nr:hypothetical protein KM92DES2_10623 [uncultured Desulfovibrio sp.]